MSSHSMTSSIDAGRVRQSVPFADVPPLVVKAHGLSAAATLAQLLLLGSTPQFCRDSYIQSGRSGFGCVSVLLPAGHSVVC